MTIVVRRSCQAINVRRSMSDDISKVKSGRTASFPACDSNFAMLACAANLSQCLASANNISRAADRHFSTFEPLCVLVDCGSAAAGRHLTSTRSRNFAIGWGRAIAACNALARISAGLRVRHSLVCRDLLLDLRHHASLWRPARSYSRARLNLILHVCRAVSRAVRHAAGIGRGMEFRSVVGFGEA